MLLDATWNFIAMNQPTVFNSNLLWKIHDGKLKFSTRFFFHRTRLMKKLLNYTLDIGVYYYIDYKFHQYVFWLDNVPNKITVGENKTY